MNGYTSVLDSRRLSLLDEDGWLPVRCLPCERSTRFLIDTSGLRTVPTLKPTDPPHGPGLMTPPQNSKGSMARHSRRILVVEDHTDTRIVLGKLLRASGYQVVEAANIAEAKKACDEIPFDVCVADITLTDGNGLDLMRELSAKYKMKGIACSGHAFDEDIQKARLAGFSEYVVKPFDMKVLLATIERIFPTPSD